VKNCNNLLNLLRRTRLWTIAECDNVYIFFKVYHLPSIYFLALINTGSPGQQQRCFDLPLPSHLLQLFLGDPKGFPNQPRGVISLASPGSAQGLFQVIHV